MSDETIKSKEAFRREAQERAEIYELKYHGCGQCTLLAFQELLGMTDPLAFKAASSFCGGMFTGGTCGALSAGIMVLGMKYGRDHVEEGLAGLLKGALPTYQFVKWFESEFGSTACREISGMAFDEARLRAGVENPKAMEAGLDPERGKKCARLVGRTAAKIAEVIIERG